MAQHLFVKEPMIVGLLESDEKLELFFFPSYSLRAFDLLSQVLRIREGTRYTQVYETWNVVESLVH